jgi:Enterobacteriaceae phage serine recombinase
MGMQVLREVGYARVSSDEQDTALQLAALRGAGCELIFEEKMSGTKKHRPALDAMLAQLRPGDRVNVWKTDRLGRSAVNSMLLLQDLADRECSFRSLTEPIDTSTPMGVAFLQMLMVFAELERATIVQRVNAGLQAARAQGIVGGTRRSLGKHEVERARDAYVNRPISPRTGRPMTVGELCELFGVSRSTFLRWANPDYFNGNTTDAARFRARHPDLFQWIEKSSDPNYGRSPKRLARGG